MPLSGAHVSESCAGINSHGIPVKLSQVKKLELCHFMLPDHFHSIAVYLPPGRTAGLSLTISLPPPS